MGDISERQAYLIAILAGRAAADLDRALKIATHTEDTRLIARVRDLRDRAVRLQNDHHEDG